MPTFKFGNMMDHFDQCDYFLITTNSFIKHNGALVMGAGIAKTIRDRWIGIDKLIGDLIKTWCGHLGLYGIIIGRKIGAFQVKRHFKDPAELDLVQGSTDILYQMAKDEPNKTFFLNFPGIGNGKLKINDVMPIIEILPDNVHVWRFDNVHVWRFKK
jgi:hypothetical protein